MEFSIIILTLAVYGLAGYLWYREHSVNYLIALAAGQLGTLFAPLWQLLYRYEYNQSFAPLFTLFGQDLPRVVFFGGWITVLPALVIFFFYRARWWFPGYMSGLLTFVLFVVYHLLIEVMGVRLRLWGYNESLTLPFGLRTSLIAALMSGLVSLGTLSLLLLTRRYALTSLLTILLPTPLVLSLFVNGVFGAPLYTALFLQSRNMASGWATVIGALGTLGLVLWGAHTVASVLDGQQVVGREGVRG